MTTSSPSRGRPVTWTKDRAIDALASVIERTGRVPMNTRLAELGAPSATTLYKLFGSRDRAVELARERLAAR